MSWLLAVSVPGVLMFSTIALQRLEGRLHRDLPFASRPAARIDRAAESARVPATPNTRAQWHGDEPTLPTKLCSAAMGTNRRFQPS